VFRRFTRTLSAEDEGRLFRAGLVPGRVAAAALEERLPAPDAAVLAQLVRGATRDPALAGRFAAFGARMLAVGAHHQFYPSSPAQVERWEKLRRALLGDGSRPAPAALSPA
jgi:hypothetical protein